MGCVCMCVRKSTENNGIACLRSNSQAFLGVGRGGATVKSITKLMKIKLRLGTEIYN